MKQAYWFRHDSNAKDDPKCMILIDQLGMEGYGIYWVLIELLRDQNGYKYPVAATGAIAKKYGTSKEKIETVINSYGLFEVVDDEYFMSPSLNKRMAPLEAKHKALSDAGKRGNKVRWHGNTGDSSPPDSQAKTTRSQLDQSKPEKSREEENKKKYRETLVSPNTGEGELPYLSKNFDNYPEELKKRAIAFQESVLAFNSEPRGKRTACYDEELIERFILCWTEPSQDLTQMRFEMEPLEDNETEFKIAKYLWRFNEKVD